MTLVEKVDEGVDITDDIIRIFIPSFEKCLSNAHCDQGTCIIGNLVQKGIYEKREEITVNEEKNRELNTYKERRVGKKGN